MTWWIVFLCSCKLPGAAFRWGGGALWLNLKKGDDTLENIVGAEGFRRNFESFGTRHFREISVSTIQCFGSGSVWIRFIEADPDPGSKKSG